MPFSLQRFISHITKETYGLVLAGSKGHCLDELTQWRAKSATYLGGKFRLIDFPISNCVNSGIRNVGVATQYKSHSLIKHINRAWGHFKKELGPYGPTKNYQHRQNLLTLIKTNREMRLIR